jgi:myo-inositol-1(or 4)-monophosphatase
MTRDGRAFGDVETVMLMNNLGEIQRVALHAAKSAGTLILSAYGNDRSISEYTKQGNEIRTDVDLAVETHLPNIISRSFPEHGVVSEEGASRNPTSDTVWIIDPIDGTANFSRHFPHFSVSIAVLHSNICYFSTVYDPCRDELFWAQKGAGSFLNGRQLTESPSLRRELKQCIAVTGFPFKNTLYKEQQMAVLGKVFDEVQEIRRTGSAALDLAYVVAGRFDLYWEFGVKPWDVAGGVFLVQEAGGIVTDEYGGGEYLKRGNLAASNNPANHKLLLQWMSS